MKLLIHSQTSTVPRKQSSWSQHDAHLGPIGPRWAPCWPDEPCYLGGLFCQVGICRRAVTLVLQHAWWNGYGSLRWRRNGHGGVSNHQPHDCLLNRLFRRRSNIKAPRHWPLCGEFTGTGEFPAQRASNAENVSIWWRHYVLIERRLWICGVFQWIKHKAVKCVCLFIYPHSTSLHWIVWNIIYNYNANMVMSFYTNCHQWLHRKSFWQL